MYLLLESVENAEFIGADASVWSRAAIFAWPLRDIPPSRASSERPLRLRSDSIRALSTFGFSWVAFALVPLSRRLCTGALCVGVLPPTVRALSLLRAFDLFAMNRYP